MQQIDGNLGEFIKESKARLKAILERLQWSEENVLKKFNTNSAVVALDELGGGEDTEEIRQKEPTLPESCATQNSIVIEELRAVVQDDAAQIPVKFSDAQVQFTREQRLWLYEYVVERTGKCTEPELQVPALNDGQTTFAEIVAQKKREKKNRRRFRTSKPTHVEEVRGLVELQMQALQQYVETRDREERKRRRSCSREKTTMQRKRSRSKEKTTQRKRSRSKHKRKRSRSRDGERRKQSSSSKKKHRKRSHSRDKNKQGHSREARRDDDDSRTRRRRSPSRSRRERQSSTKRNERAVENGRGRSERSPRRMEPKNESSQKDRSKSKRSHETERPRK